VATIANEWSEGSVSIAVETGKDDANREGVHVHIYKKGSRTKAFISLSDYSKKGIDENDFETACKLFNQNFSEIKRYYDMTGNNVNHPNDFLVRAYAQAVLTAISGADYWG